MVGDESAAQTVLWRSKSAGIEWECRRIMDEFLWTGREVKCKHTNAKIMQYPRDERRATEIWQNYEKETHDFPFFSHTQRNSKIKYERKCSKWRTKHTRQSNRFIAETFRILEKQQNRTRKKCAKERKKNNNWNCRISTVLPHFCFAFLIGAFNENIKICLLCYSFFPFALHCYHASHS